MLSVVAIGAIVIALSIWCIVRNKATKTAVWLALIGGLTVGAGMFHTAAVKIADHLAAANGKGTAYLFGAAVPAVIAVIMLAELVHAGHPKKGRPHRYAHPIIAFLAPAVLLTAGGIFSELVGWGQDAVNTVPTSVHSSSLGR